MLAVQVLPINSFRGSRLVQNPQRPTPTKKLVLIGVVAGIAIAVVAFMSGATNDTGMQFGKLGRVALFGAVAIGGGWAALRRKSPK